MCMLDTISAKRDEIYAAANSHKAERLWVFGSCARKEEGPDSDVDFIVDFARVLPGLPKAQVKSRVILAPEHAKRLLAALQENIMRYEKEFGTIRIPNQESRTIAPFDLSKGEA